MGLKGFDTFVLLYVQVNKSTNVLNSVETANANKSIVSPYFSMMSLGSFQATVRV